MSPMSLLSSHPSTTAPFIFVLEIVFTCRFPFCFIHSIYTRSSSTLGFRFDVN